MFDKIHPYYYLGGLIGLVSGFLISKVYQIWAIVYRESHFDPNMSNSWETNSPPLWITATESPMMFTLWIVLIFIIFGVIFVKVILNNNAK